MRVGLILALLLPSCGGAAAVPEVISKALPYLESKGGQWMQKRKCVSCHQITSMLWSLGAVEQSGIGFDGTKLATWRKWAVDQTTALDADPKRTPPVDNMVKLMLGNADRAQGDLFAAFPAWILKQSTNDHWKAGGQLPRQKRPARETDEVTTLWTMLALAPHARKDPALAERLRRADTWVAQGRPGVSTEWWVVRALTSKGRDRRQRFGRLLELQNDDGGWGWIAGEKSDALATGLALYGLSRSGKSSDHDAILAARKFLSSSQRDDGSWEVPSTKKANKGESGPVSDYWGTAWAVVGLAVTMD
jgi:hypothetical protein